MAEQPVQHGNDSTFQSTLFRLGTAGFIGCLLAVTLFKRKAERVVGLRAILDGRSPKEVLPCFADPARYLSFSRVPVQPLGLETETDEDGTVCHTYQIPGPSFVVHEVQSNDRGARIVISLKGASTPLLIKYDLQTVDSPQGTKVLMVGKLDAPWYRVNKLAEQLEAEEQYRLERVVEEHETNS